MQHIQFDNFKIWEGKCEPDQGINGAMVGTVKPEWPGMMTDLNAPTDLETVIRLESGFGGGGCPKLEIINNSNMVCTAWEMELNVRPNWANVGVATRGLARPMSMVGLKVLERNVAAGAAPVPPAHTHMHTQTRSERKHDKLGWCEPREPSLQELCDKGLDDLVTVAVS